MNKPITILFLVIVLSACKGKDHQPGHTATAETSSGSEGSFTIKAPPGWTKSDTVFMGRDITLLRSKEEPGDDFIENANVITEPVGDMDLDEYYKKSVANMKMQLTDFVVVAEHKTVISHTNFAELQYSHVYSGTPIDVDVYMAVNKKTGYVITCSTKKGNLAKWQDIFDEIVASFSLK